MLQVKPAFAVQEQLVIKARSVAKAMRTAAASPWVGVAKIHY